MPEPNALGRRDFAIGLALLFLGALVFTPSLNYQFLNWDDGGYLTENSWLGPLSPGRLLGPYRTTYFHNYHPLTITMLQLEYALFGLNPPVHRAINFVLHGGCVAMMYVVARLLGSDRVLAAIASAFFAVHPLRIESVVWLSERKDVLCGIFFLAALAAWLNGNASPSSGLRWRAASFALYVLALLSKAMAVSFPLVVIAADFLWRRDLLRRRIALYVTMLLISVLFSYLNWIAQDSAIRHAQSLLTRLRVAVWSPMHYMTTTLYPASLSPLYPRTSCPALVPAAAVSAIAFCVAMVFITWSLRDRFKPLCFGLVSAAFVMAPVSGIVGFGYCYAADRYSYLPSAILFAGMAATLSAVKGFDDKKRRLATLMAVILLPIYAGLAFMQLPAWRSSTSLWATVLELNPGDLLARTQLAGAQSTRAQRLWEKQGYSPQVFELLGRALEARPGDPRALIMYTSALIGTGRLDEAEATVARALSDSKDRPISKSCALAVSCVIARERGNVAQSEKFAAEAFSYMPERSSELCLLAKLASDLGRMADAERYYRQVLKSEPMHQEALEGLAKVKAEAGRVGPSVQPDK